MTLSESSGSTAPSHGQSRHDSFHLVYRNIYVISNNRNQTELPVVKLHNYTHICQLSIIWIVDLVKRMVVPIKDVVKHKSTRNQGRISFIPSHPTKTPIVYTRSILLHLFLDMEAIS